MPKVTDAKRLKYLYQPNPNYLYFRMPNGKLIPLPLDQNSAEFKRIYAECLKVRTARAPTPVPPSGPRLNGVARFIGGTVGAGIQKYRESSAPKGFRRKSKLTQKCYGLALNIMRDRIGDVLLRDIDINRVDRYTESLANEFGNSTADLHRALLSLIWQTCRKFPEFKIEKLPNPTREATKHYGKPKQSHLPWTAEQVERFAQTAPQNLKDAMLLLEFSLQRGGDCIKLKWTDFDGEGLTLVPEKGEDGGIPKVHYAPCPAPLLRRLKQMQKERGDSDYILTNTWGKPWASSATLGDAIRKHLRKVGLGAKGNPCGYNGTSFAPATAAKFDIKRLDLLS
jgi:integrase